MHSLSVHATRTHAHAWRPSHGCRDESEDMLRNARIAWNKDHYGDFGQPEPRRGLDFCSGDELWAIQGRDRGSDPLGNGQTSRLRISRSTSIRALIARK